MTRSRRAAGPASLRWLFAAALISSALVTGFADGEAARAGEGDTANLTAEQILARVVEVYSRCKSYRDSGLVTTVFIHSAWPNYTEEKPFTTAFVRPDRFRFEYTENGKPWNHYVIWRQGEAVRTWWGVDPGVHESPSLGMALSAATGVSSGSARRIPGLLLSPREFGAGWEILRLKNLRRLSDARLREADCLRVEGERDPGEPATLWIARTTFLIRRIDEPNAFRDFRTEETTTYEPRIDVDIPASLLEFGAPPPR